MPEAWRSLSNKICLKQVSCKDVLLKTAFIKTCFTQLLLMKTSLLLDYYIYSFGQKTQRHSIFSKMDMNKKALVVLTVQG